MSCSILWLYFIVLCSNAVMGYQMPYRYHTALMRTSKLFTSTDDHTVTQGNERVINITPKAMGHLQHLIKKNPDKQVLRMGVKAGGCSGMSYVMDLVESKDVMPDDHQEYYGEGIQCAVDPKSLLFLYGLQLDYSDELIGGGFKFSNPNADKSCGCGKSFGV